MEYRDLYDEKRNLTGEYILKGEEIPEGRFILMVVIFIENSKGQFLMQKRCKEKGALWATTGGHPKKGETSLEGIYEECKEELGVSINEPTLFKQASGKNSYCDLYYLKQDLENIVIQEEDVTDEKLLEAVNKADEHKTEYIKAMEKSQLNNSIEKIVGLIKQATK